MLYFLPLRITCKNLFMNFCLFFILYIGFHSFICSLYSAEGEEHLKASAIPAITAAPPPQKLMGIEIETSAIKIHSPDEDNKISFTIDHLAGKKWMIEEDTSDATFSENPPYAGFDRNLELKTIRGFNQIEIQHVILPMKDLLNYFHASARPSLQITASGLSAFFGTIVTAESTNPPEVSIKSKEDDTSVRPQITYQLPLHLLPQVFERLRFLGHEKVNDFLDCLDSSVPLTFGEAEITAKLQSRLLIRRNVGHDQKLQLFFKRDIAEAIHNVTHRSSQNVKGFCYLFFYYWYVIFNNKENPADDSEPGPKKSLAILSRVPISQLFDKLNLEEKTEVHNVLAPIIALHGAHFRIRGYSNYDAHTIFSPITLQDWYESVVNPAARMNGADLLSPPPGLGDDYSMGTLDIDADSSGLALIEVRGYATLAVNGAFSMPVINNVDRLVQNEAAWFFGIH